MVVLSVAFFTVTAQGSLWFHFVITSNNSEGMFHHTDRHTRKPIKAHAAHALCHAHTYPAATQKGVADLCLHTLLRLSRYVAICD